MSDIVKVGQAPLVFSEEQRHMIRNAFAKEATEAEFEVLLEMARARNLNPLLKQIYFVKYSDKWVCQVGIDGFRAIAQRSGLYGGQDEPVYTYAEDGSLISATVRVYRKDWERPCVATALFREYQSNKGLWPKMPALMLAKCAESLALRKAFPEDLGGLYTPEEMDQAAREFIDPVTGEVLAPYEYFARRVELAKTKEELTDVGLEIRKAFEEKRITANEKKSLSPICNEALKRVNAATAPAPVAQVVEEPTHELIEPPPELAEAT